MAMKSKRKGKKGELEAVALLKAHGFPDAARGQQFKGGGNSPDVTGLPGFHIEVKRAENFHLYPALDQACADAGGTLNVPLVLHRRSDKPWVAVLKAFDLLILVERLRRLEKARDEANSYPQGLKHG